MTLCLFFAVSGGLNYGFVTTQSTVSQRRRVSYATKPLLDSRRSDDHRRVYQVETAKKDVESLIVSMLEAKTFSARRLGANSLIKLICTSK